MTNAYQYIKQNIRNNLRSRLIEWRTQTVAFKVDKPTDIGRARNLGYKDKKGFVIVRIRLNRGGRWGPKINKGRRTARQSTRKVLKMNYQWVAEQRAARKFTNLEVLNSYKVGKDGKHYFFEVIMVDPSRPEITNDPGMKWIAESTNRGRAFRGLTSAAKKSRGLMYKSPEMKVRPSLRAWGRQGK